MPMTNESAVRAGARLFAQCYRRNIKCWRVTYDRRVESQNA